MKVKELIEKLQAMPQDMDVILEDTKKAANEEFDAYYEEFVVGFEDVCDDDNDRFEKVVCISFNYNE